MECAKPCVCIIGDLMILMFGPDPMNPQVDSAWNHEPCRHLYRHLLKVFNIMAGLVPLNMRTGRCDTQMLQSHTLFSKDWLDYWIFKTMLEKRAGTTEMAGQDIPIVWWTSPSREFRCMGKYIRLRDNVALAPQPMEEDTAEDDEEEALLKYSKDEFWTMLKSEKKIGVREINSGLWIGMMVRKSIIDYLCELDLLEPRPTNITINPTTIGNHIWTSMKDCQLRKFWRTNTQLNEWLKSHLFKSRLPAVGEIDLEFLTKSYEVDANTDIYGAARDAAWRAALVGTSREKVCALYAHLKAHRQGSCGGVRHSMIYTSWEDPGLVDDGPIDLPKAMVKSVYTGKTSPQLLHSLCVFRKFYQDTRIACAREARGVGKPIHKDLEENLIFVELVKKWGLDIRRIAAAPKNRKRTANQM